jgi:transcriptional regulator of heat shock response
MSHWYRAPRQISLRELIRRSGEGLVLDRGVRVPSDILQALSKRIQNIEELNSSELSPKEKARLCQELQSLLLTSDDAVISLLSSESEAPWGAVLLPNNEDAQVNVLRRLSRDELSTRPSIDPRILVEHVRRNRLFLDLRPRDPIISVFCNCRWMRSQRS